MFLLNWFGEYVRFSDNTSFFAGVNGMESTLDE